MTSWAQFVDSVSATPTIRLDLDGPAFKLQRDGTDFGTPELNRATVSTLMTDGDPIPAAAYGNRVLTLALKTPDNPSADTVATRLQQLVRELDRTTNYLRYQPDTSAPVFFRTMRSDIGTPTWDPVEKRFIARVVAEPFALGLREDVSPGSAVSNNPAAATNPGYFDISSVKGDVETPLLLNFTSTGTSGVGNKQTVLAVRRRGDPTAVSFLVQSEAMTLGTDVTLPGNDAAMSGSSSNYARCSFATVPASATRLSSGFPVSGTATVEARGQYRVWGRFRKSVAGDVIYVGFGYGSSASIFNGWVQLPQSTNLGYVDLGYMPVPAGADPVDFGYNSSLKALMSTIALFAYRQSGSGNFDTDFLLFMPADDRYGLIDWPGTDVRYVADGIRTMAYPINSGQDTVGTVDVPAGIAGGLPMISPGVTNRIYMIRDVTSAVTDAIGNTTPISAYYWPRYQFVRPPTT